MTGTEVTFQADAGESNNVRVDFNQSGGGVAIKDGTGPTAGTGCSPGTSFFGTGYVFCNTPGMTGITKVNVDTGDGTDTVVVHPTFMLGPAKPLDVHLGPDNDAWGGNELAGADWTTNDHVDGGSGDDVLVMSGPGSDTLAGGSGTGDTVQLPVDAPGASMVIGQGAIGADVERLTGAEGNDRLVGSGATNVLTGQGGNDEIEGLGGTDLLSGGDGDDTLKAADGEPDQVSCGPGSDTAEVDDVDEVEAAACEILSASVAIASGPPSLTDAGTAAFEFAVVGSPPPGQLECRLDDFGFAECASPKTFTNVPEGEHVFAVRYKADGAAAGAATERRWTVDTTAPTAIVDSAPSGDTNPSDVTVTFHSSEPDGAVFECTLDGAARTPCSSPLRLTGLTPGPHSLGIRATDAAGNTGSDTSAEFGVGGQSGFPVRPATGCTGSSVATVTFGPIVAIAPTDDACFSSETIDGRSVRVSRATVLVNGLRITPKAGVKIIVDGVLGGGTVRSTGEVEAGLGRLSFGLEELGLDSLTSTGAVRALGRVTGVLSSLGAPIISPTVEFSGDNDGQTKINMSVKLPDVFTALPASPGQSAELATVSGDLAAVASNKLGVFFTGKLQISDAWLRGKVKLKDLTLAFDQSAGTLEGSVGLALAKGSVHPPGISEDAVLTASVTIGPDGFLGALRKLGLEASNLAVHIGYGFFFQRVGGSLEKVGDALKTTFSGGASWGPKLEVEVGGVKIFDGEIVSLDGTYTLAVPSSAANPVVVGATGEGKVFDIPFVSGAVTYSNPGGITLTGTYDYTIAGYGFLARIDRAWFDPATDDFSIEASGESRLPPLAGTLFDGRVNVVVSKAGFAACFGQDGDSAGFGRRWGQSLDVWADSCDVGPFRRGSASAAADGSRSFAIPPRARVAVIEVRGASGPPKLELAPPGGAPVVRSPAATGILSRRDVLLVEDAGRATTSVVLTRPAAGRWGLRALEGSELVEVRIADGLPPVSIRAKVRGRGDRRTLTWRATGARGHRLTFVERGGGGSARRLTGTSRSSGRLRFAPSPLVRGARRRIEVIVTRRGLPRATRVVAKFRATVALPGRTKRVRRRGKRLTWRRIARAASYAIAVRLTDGRTVALASRRPRIALPAGARKGRLTVTIVGIDTANRPGRRTTVHIR